MASTSSSTLGLLSLNKLTNKIPCSTSSYLLRKKHVPLITSKPDRIISVSCCLLEGSSVEAVKPVSDKVKVETWQSQFPVLSIMARDLLSVQASTVASESAFSLSGRIEEQILEAETGYQINLSDEEIVLDEQARLKAKLDPIQGLRAGQYTPRTPKLFMWNWKGYSIRYQYAGDTGPALVLVHGFGANSDHWRKNIPVLAESHRVFSIDLIGYGYSDKPNPRELGDNPFYTFETWGSQLNDFCREVVKDEAFFICNSIGGLVGLQAAVTDPTICKGVMLLNISLRMLHITKQPWFGRPLIRSFQNLLRNYTCGKVFFITVATRVSSGIFFVSVTLILPQLTNRVCRHQLILRQGLELVHCDVFLEFTFVIQDGPPLPGEDILPQVKCPVLVVWGDKDPWEPIELGRAYGDFDSVEDFVALPDVGHCPQDEAPHLVNPLVESFAARHATVKN
ncbi:pheophytinase, chloroplastic [Tanacetum coccineum]|uniref:Pheophytinase, chloroplastic n=1 Tax=Tanacetum coccineum TaxID=301880 RepID=A0ABQ5CF29_9ASTR